MEKKKILFFDFITHFGGAQQCTTLLCSELKEEYDISIVDAYGFCDKYLGSLRSYGLTPHILVPNAKKVYIGNKNKKFKRLWSLVKQIPGLLVVQNRLINQVLKINPSVIWTNSIKSFFFLFFNWRLRKYPKILYVHTWFKREELSFFDRWLVKRADAIFAVSRATADAMCGWGVKQDKIFVVYHAIDFKKIIESSNVKVTNIPPKSNADLIILVPGQLVRTKGQHAAIEAAKILKDKGFDFTMWIVGDQKVGDSNYADLLRGKIEKFQLKEHVYMLGWRDDMAGLMKLSDIVLFPTHSEGLGKVIEEGMILKRNVISTPVGGVNDLILDGQTGLLVSVDDSVEMARSVEKLVSEKDLSSQIVANAYEYINENFSVEKHVKLVSEALQKITENG